MSKAMTNTLWNHVYNTVGVHPEDHGIIWDNREDCIRTLKEAGLKHTGVPEKPVRPDIQEWIVDVVNQTPLVLTDAQHQEVINANTKELQQHWKDCEDGAGPQMGDIYHGMCMKMFVVGG